VRSAPRPLRLLLLLFPLAGAAPADDSDELVYNTEGNRLRRFDVDTIGGPRLLDEVLIERASAGEFGSAAGGPGRDVNGTICPFPDASGRFVAGEDTGQPTPPAGWGVFDARGRQIGKLTATYQIAGAEPFGCAFDPGTGILYTTEVGSQGFTNPTGQLIMWFPPYDRFPGSPGAYPDTNAPSDNFCKLAINLNTGGGVTVDDQGRIYAAATALGGVHRFSLPTLAPGQSFDPRDPNTVCTDVDPQGSPYLAAALRTATGFREQLIPPASDGKMMFFSGLAMSPVGTLYAASVLTGRIAEYDLDGNLLRYLLDHSGPVFGPSFALPMPFGNPQNLAVGADGSVYYPDLDLQGSLPDIGPGPDGKVWRIRFDANGDPLMPEVVRDGLAFPDGVGIFPGNLQTTEWLTYGGSAARKNYVPDETIVTKTNVAALAQRWSVPTDAIVTGSPVVAAVDLPGEGLSRLVYFLSWDLHLYAARLRDGSVVWKVRTEDQPGASFPGTASVHVAKLANRDRVFVGQGEIFYSFDAVTGEELWRFAAGTGCRDEEGSPPGLCGFSGERNEIESSAYVADGQVFFGMDVNDVATGKGGFYALDALTGSMRWFFDLESGSTCRPFEEDDVRAYDPYHSEEELGLPAGFLTTRPGCDHPRTPNGCGNVWSSPAVDLARSALFAVSSNCDMPIDPESGEPLTMPPFDEAIFSLGFDGTPRWVWRPRRADNDDLAFGAVPNLFQIEVELAGQPTLVDVVGVGGKDGSYYVLDRDGTNQANGAAWDDSPESHLPADLPYWATDVVAGGDIGGIIATAAADEDMRRILFATAPGLSSVNAPPAAPQQPVFHALDMDSGAVLWQQNSNPASFSATTAVPGVTFTGTALGAVLRARDADNGNALDNFALDNAGMGAPTVVLDGMVLVGEGIGSRTATGSQASDLVANLPAAMNALCVPGTSGCAACDNGVDDDGDGDVDAAQDAGCVDTGDDSEVLGDLDYDGDVDAGDSQRFFAAFGRAPGDVGYTRAADLVPAGAPDGEIDLLDWQAWLAAELAANPPPPPACGLLGAEPLLLLAGLGALRRRRRAGAAGARRAGPGGAPARAGALLLAMLGAFAAAPEAHATATLRFELAPGTTVVGGAVRLAAGESFEVDVVADLSEAIVGFGFDASFDSALLARTALAIGPAWVAVNAPDGDGLAGLSPLPGRQGTDVLLATFAFEALAPGLADIVLGITSGDNAEGFARVQLGVFDAVVLPDPLAVEIVPEPASAALLALGLAGLAARRRGRRG
jgi:outer membrane protein assembly factor BamB